MPSHERHGEQIRYSLEKEMNEIYWATAIKTFAIELVGLYTPIFIFLYFEKSFVAVFIFFGAQFFFQTLLVPLAARLIGKLGIKKLMAIGGPFFGVYLICLSLAQTYGIIFIILALAAKVLYLVLFWPSRHIDFAKFASKKKRARQISMLSIINTLISAIAPLLGALMITAFGYATTFTISAALLLLASVPLFFSPEIYESYSLTWRQSFLEPFKKRNLKTSIAFFFEGMEYYTSLVLLSLFIYVVIGDLEIIGLITSITLIMTLVFTYFVGWISDRRGSRQIISFASVVHAFVWLICAFITTPLQCLIYLNFFKFAETANHLPFSSLFYKKAHKKRHNIDEFIIYHEIAHNSGRVLMAIIFIVGFSFGHTSFLLYFSIAAFAALMYRLIK
ncbi:MAG: MFS transporter [bacterium]|nr:MFS transporter [bacterium]